MNKIFYILSLTLIIANNAPIWTDIPSQNIEEDCDPCLGFPFDLESYVSDVDGDDLTITIPDDITGATFSINGFLLDIILDDNWYGAINFDVTASDGIDSSSTGFNVEVQSINDAPYFEPIGDGNIIMYEDIIYQELWLSIVSSGNEYEDDNLFFVLDFDDESLLFDDAPNTFLSPYDNTFQITPKPDQFGSTSFTVKLVDTGGAESNEYTYNLTVNAVNDAPILINQIADLTYDEDCCLDAGIELSLDYFEVVDVDNTIEELELKISEIDIPADAPYIVDGLVITPVENYFGEIIVPVYLFDNDASNPLASEQIDCFITINPINDPPYFESVSDGINRIEIFEDIIFTNNNQLWAFVIDPGNIYENEQSFSFEINLDNDNNNIIQSAIISNEGIIEIIPNSNAYGTFDISVTMTDDGTMGGAALSDIHNYTLEIIPINDNPYFDFTILNDSLIIDEDSDPINSIYIIDIHPGGGDGLFKENDDILNFDIGDYDDDLFDDNNLPAIEMVEESALLSFGLEKDYNGNTNFPIRLNDDGASSSSNQSNLPLFYDDTLNIQINQINDMPREFSIYYDLHNHQSDLTTFSNDSAFFRFPYQPFYVSSDLLANKLRFKWERIQMSDTLDIDIYPSINKDFIMDSIYYELQMFSLTDTIILNEFTYDPLSTLDTIIVDIDLTLEEYNIDLTGNTLYNWRVLTKNNQFDNTLEIDPVYISNNEDYSFSVDLILPTLDMNYLHDDIFIEHFDLYMKASENFVDFDDFNRPLKLWIYYNSVESQPEILFPNLKDTLNNIYFSSYNFKHSGDIDFIYQMRDQAANINQDSLNVSFDIIDPSFSSSILFDNDIIELKFSSKSVNSPIPCLISKTEINYENNLDLIGYPIKIHPANIELNNSAVISFDLSFIPEGYDLNHCGLYYYNNYNWILSNTYVEDNKLKSRINKFGSYAIFYNEYEETLSFPDEYILMQNYPNPFNPETMINFYLPEDNYIEVNIYNIKGEKVRTIYKGQLRSGYQSIIWNGTNDRGTSLSSGIYIMSLNYDDMIINSKMVKLK